MGPTQTAWLAAWVRGCKFNATVLPGYTVADFQKDIKDTESFNRRNASGLYKDLLPELTKPKAAHNPLARQCMPAVVRALGIMRLELIQIAFRYGVDSDSLWNSAFQGVISICRAIQLLTCSNCPDEAADIPKAVLKGQAWASTQWVDDAWSDVSKDWERQVSAQEDYGNILTSWQDTRDAEHRRLFRDGIALLENLREQGLINSWFVARGTMIFAMRYGQTRGNTLPSGLRDLPTVPPLDMDTYVFTDHWSDVRMTIGNMARDFNFTWCGFQHGWPKGHTSCLRADAELEVNYAPPSWAPSVFPMTRCLVQGIQEDEEEDAPEAGEAPGSPGRADKNVQTPYFLGRSIRERLELPCPADPRSLMRHIWKDKDAALLDCLPLPSSLITGERSVLSEDDVGWLIDRAGVLEKAGFANMVEYFKDCSNHPHAEVARHLYAKKRLSDEHTQSAAKLKLL